MDVRREIKRIGAQKALRIPWGTQVIVDKSQITTPSKDPWWTLTDMVETALKHKVDSHYEPNNCVASEIDLTRYVQKHIAEKYNFTEWKDENKSAFVNYQWDASRTRFTVNESSFSPSPGDQDDRTTILNRSSEKIKPPAS